MLKKHCYQCHGYKGSVEGGMNYILNVPRLTERGQLVPGKPFKSPLFQRIVSEEMPPEDADTEISEEDIEVLSQWIKAGAPDFRPPAAKRKFISNQDIVDYIARDLEQASSRTRRFLRYFTVTNLHNQQLSNDELQTYRRGLSKLLNSLSWNSEITIFQPIDPAKTVLRIDLRDLNWNQDTWTAILEAYPYGLILPGRGTAQVQEWTETDLPHVRADWFVAMASRPPLYHKMLEIPETDAELEQILRIRVRDNIEQERVARAGFNGSGVSRNNRLIERHRSPYGAYWKSYDFEGNRGRQNLFAYPLGPYDDESFEHAGGEIIFNLPNGMQGYMLTDARGRRIDKGPTEIVSDPKRPDRAVENGLSCMSCHSRGIIEKSDQIRPHVEQNRSAFHEEDVEYILSLFPPREEMRKLMKEDAERFRKAVIKTGGQVTATEPIVALAQRFEEELDLMAAASEAGVDREQLTGALRSSKLLARKLGILNTPGGTVQRQVFVGAFRDVARELRLGDCRDHVGELRRFEGHTERVPEVVFSPDGDWLLSGSEDRTIRLWKLTTGEELGEFEKFTDKVRCAAFSPNGKWFAVGTYDGIIRVYDGNTLEMMRELEGHRDRVFDMAFTPDSHKLFSAGMDASIRQWDLRAWRQVGWLRGHASWVRSVDLSPDGTQVLSGGNDAAFIAWDAELLRPTAVGKIAHTAPLSKVCFVPEARRALTSGFDNMIRLWDTTSWRKIREYEGGMKPVRDLAVAPDGKTFASIGEDNVLRLWDTESGKVLMEILAEGGLASVAFSPDGKRVATGGADGVVSLWGLPQYVEDHDD